MSIRYGNNIIAGFNTDSKTNCITEIPQDIKLELNNGTLTLKAGSKIYVPNGVGVFDLISIENDLTYTATFTNNAAVLFLNTNTTPYSFHSLINQHISSGPTAPSNPGTYQTWYDTSTNLIKRYEGGWVSGFSFPICIYSLTSGGITSIDQVFNGFGYIGSTVFVLPGVKGLMCNGRNPDGTLNNTKVTFTNVKIADDHALQSDRCVIMWRNDGSLFTSPIRYYNETENYIVNKNTNAREVGVIIGACNRGTDGKISDFVSKSAFHAVDYSEADFVVAFQKPTSENNYTWYRKYASGWVEEGCLNCSLAAQEANSQAAARCNFPITMADTIYHTTWIRTADGGNTYELTQTNTFKTTTYVDVYFFSTVATTGASTVDISVCGMAA